MVFDEIRNVGTVYIKPGSIRLWEFIVAHMMKSMHPILCLKQPDRGDLTTLPTTS